MYNLSFCSSFFNKIIALLLTVSLLSVSFSFNFDKGIKQELNALYEATSVCEYYNTLTNFSYGIINKILESTNIVLTETSSQKDKTENKDQKNNKQNDLYFVKSTNEKEINHLKSFNTIPFFNTLLNKNICFNFLLNKNIFNFLIFQLSCTMTFFCYFARRSIDDNIIINNILIKNRLV